MVLRWELRELALLRGEAAHPGNSAVRDLRRARSLVFKILERGEKILEVESREHTDLG
jgi:hypothetical protein